MFSPICQQSISTQVLGSREEKSFYQALRWWWGRSSAGWLEAVEICHVTLELLLQQQPPWCLLFLPAFYWLKFLFAYNAVLWSRWDSTSPDNIWLSPKRKLLSKKTSPCDPEMLCRACLADTLLVSPEICDCILVCFEQTQEKPGSSGAALSSPGQFASLTCFNNTLDAPVHTVEKFCEKWKSMISLNYGLQWQDGENEAVFFSIYIVLRGDSKALPGLAWIMSH